MSLILLLVALLVVAFALWAARRLIAAFKVPDPFATVIYIIVALVCVLWLLSLLGVFPGGPLIRLR